MFPGPAHRAQAPASRAARLILTALLACASLVILGAGTATGAPGTVRVLDLSPSLGHSIAIARPGGGHFTDDPGRAVVRVTPAGGGAWEVTAWCVDSQRAIREGHEYDVDLETSADTPELAGAAFAEAAWLMSRADDLIAAAPGRGFEAAAIQVAVWQLSGQAADRHDVTWIPPLNARVAALRAMARGRTVTTTLALNAPAGAVEAGQPTAVVVTGTPGAVVDLEATGGAALSADRVTLDDDGRAEVSVSAPAAGGLTVTARAQGGMLWRAAHLPGRDGPQDVAFVRPVTVTAAVALTVTAPPAPVPPAVVGTPTAPPAITPPRRPAARRAALRLVKRAPARARSGRVIRYTLTVTNVSRRAARAVVLRDRIPAGTVLVRRPARARISRGSVVWRLGTIAPRRSVRVHLVLRTRPDAHRAIRNVAVATAANARTVRARALTLVRPVRVAPAVQPAVTG